MSAKGWVSRKREQFELFAKTEQDQLQRRPVSPVSQEQEPPSIISLYHSSRGRPCAATYDQR